jgi:hypothetical protein
MRTLLTEGDGMRISDVVLFILILLVLLASLLLAFLGDGSDFIFS